MSGAGKLRLGLAVLAATLAVADPASAAFRYGAPSGTGTACTVPLPCSLATAITSAVAGDEVLVAAGN